MARPGKRPKDPLVEHARLGHSVRLSEGNECSLCGQPCPAVPLILWNDSGDIAWRYCERCEGEIMALAIKNMKT